jgi:hypothetical protein
MTKSSSSIWPSRSIEPSHPLWRRGLAAAGFAAMLGFAQAAATESELSRQELANPPPIVNAYARSVGTSVAGMADVSMAAGTGSVRASAPSTSPTRIPDGPVAMARTSAPATEPTRLAMAQRSDRRIVSNDARRWSFWCGRSFVLMVGIGY